MPTRSEIISTNAVDMNVHPTKAVLLHVSRGTKKPAEAGFSIGAANAYFSSSVSSLRIFAPVAVVTGLLSLVSTVTSLALPLAVPLTSTR
jgi:hypothetical protein